MPSLLYWCHLYNKISIVVTEIHGGIKTGSGVKAIKCVLFQVRYYKHFYLFLPLPSIVLILDILKIKFR